jgi:hypothetical protein
MCFSATASFATSGILLPLGLYSFIKALKTNKRYIPFSLIPIIFSIHQFIEGMIWDKLHTHPYTSWYQSVLGFTFIAFFVWPVYIPFSVYFIEPKLRQQRILSGLFVAGIILSIAIYLPIFIGQNAVDVHIVRNSLAYLTDHPPLLQKTFTLSYVIIIFLSLFLCSIKEIKVFGLVLLGSFLLSFVWFYFALSSVWCFFAALLSSYIAYFMHALSK